MPDVDRDAVTLRFEILWSRLPVLLGSEETAELRSIAGAVAVLDGFLATLMAIEPDVLALTRTDRERHDRIRSALTARRDDIRTLSMQVYNGEHFQTLAERTRQGYRQAETYQWAMLAVVAVLVAFLGIEILHGARRARREAAARRAAEAASLAKSTFLAAMSHELRTPLNAIMGFSEIQARQVFGPMPERYRGYAADIHASADHLLSVLNDILDMARMDALRLTLNEQVFDPSEALRTAVRMIEAAAEAAGLRLVVDDRVGDARLLADQRLFRQIILNLVSNSVKFTPAGGTVWVALETGGEGLTLSVRDTGVGIPPTTLHRVTEPFFQADQSYARRHQGIGLGLSLVNGFAELHGAALEIDSAPGIGTRVAVVFPAVRIVLPDPADPADPAGAGAARASNARDRG